MDRDSLERIHEYAVYGRMKDSERRPDWGRAEGESEDDPWKDSMYS